MDTKTLFDVANIAGIPTEHIVAVEKFDGKIFIATDKRVVYYAAEAIK